MKNRVTEKVRRRMYARVINFLAVRPLFYVIFCRLFSCTPYLSSTLTLRRKKIFALENVKEV